MTLSEFCVTERSLVRLQVHIAELNGHSTPQYALELSPMMSTLSAAFWKVYIMWRNRNYIDLWINLWIRLWIIYPSLLTNAEDVHQLNTNCASHSLIDDSPPFFKTPVPPYSTRDYLYLVNIFRNLVSRKKCVFHSLALCWYPRSAPLL